MMKAYQFRLYPNQEQKIYFANCFGSARFIFNQMLADRKKNYETYKDGKIKLPKIGFVTIKQHRDFDGLIKSCTISMNKAGNYFISILVAQETPEWLPAEHKIGIDLGISDFAITTNDAGNIEKHPNPKCLRKSEKKVKQAQRALSRKQKGSKNLLALAK